MKSKDISQKITDALLELMKTNDYDSISITDIVNKAGLSRVTYYRHFNSKEDILIRYFQITKEKFVAQTRLSDGQINNEMIIINLFYNFKANMEANKALRKAKLENQLLNYLSTEFLSNLPVKLDKYIAYFIAGALFNVLINWLDNDCTDPVEDVSKPFMYLNQTMTSLINKDNQK